MLGIGFRNRGRLMRIEWRDSNIWLASFRRGIAGMPGRADSKNEVTGKRVRAANWLLYRNYLRSLRHRANTSSVGG